MIDIYEIKLVDLLPLNIAQDAKVQAAAAALDAELLAITEAVTKCLISPRIDELPESVIDHLAWERHVDFYEQSMSIETKRELVRQSVPWHRRKGTPAAVEELIIAIYGEGKVLEWFEYGGDPYKFKVITNNQDVMAEEYERFVKALNSVKNTRSWLDEVETTMIENLLIYFGAAVYAGDKVTIEQVG